MSEPIVSDAAYNLAVIAVIAAWGVAALVAFIVLTLRNAALGHRLAKLCGSYEQAVRVIHAVETKRTDRQMTRGIKSAVVLRMVKR